MSDFEKDILDRIAFDFGNKKDEAMGIIEKSIRAHEYLNKPRIIRCIVFLANGTIPGLRGSLDMAESDPRDVMLFAEYKTSDNLRSLRIRDFNKVFGKEMENVQE